MKQHAKPARHEGRRKPFKEEHQMVIACGTLIALLAMGIWVVGTYVPMAPLPGKPVNASIKAGPR